MNTFWIRQKESEETEVTKINKEEYEILKNLDEKWKWIAKDDNYGGFIFCFREKPHKDIRKGGWSPDTTQYKCLWEYDVLFQFIQWEDEEPHNIAELIEEYESEETEVKKDLNWFKEQLDDIETNSPRLWTPDSIWMLDKVYELLNQLDEPEVLSQEWIEDNEYRVIEYPESVVPSKKLQTLLVPKQEEVDRAYKDGYEKGKQHTFYKGYLEGLADKEKESETVADVVSTFWKSFERLKEVMNMEVEELEE